MLQSTLRSYLERLGHLHKVKYYSLFKYVQENNMQAKNLKTDSKIVDVNSINALSTARQALGNGEVIAVPTDTVYGLACDATNESAVQKLYDIKGREAQKPVAICVKNLAAFRHYGKSEHLSNELLECLLPGPITIVVNRSPNLINSLNPTCKRIGIRIPDFPFLQKLNALCEQPFALTSANLSGQPSSVNINEFDVLWPHLSKVFDYGQLGSPLGERLASTVIDLSVRGQYRIIREGAALKETLNILHTHGIKNIEEREKVVDL